MTQKIHIGTSGWAYDEWRGNFYPPGMASVNRLPYYSCYFNCVEINNSFYRIPQLRYVQRWVNAVPADFRFSFKIWRGITHADQLLRGFELMEEFMAALEPAKEKAAPLLLQLPPRFDSSTKETFETALRHIATIAPDWRIAVEFRDPAWYCAEIADFLNTHRAALVLHDMPVAPIAQPAIAAPFIYKRYHGVKGSYKGAYREKYLKSEAQQLLQWQAEGKDVYVYFNNTADASAPLDALRLQRLVGHRPHIVAA